MKKMEVRINGLYVEMDEGEVNSLLIIPTTPFSEDFWNTDEMQNTMCFDVDIYFTNNEKEMATFICTVNFSANENCTEVHQVEPELSECCHFLVRRERYRKFYNAWHKASQQLSKGETAIVFLQ